ncbi:hypothetical protein ACQEU3_24070 [Spirillospora sp. CA-253888]
MRPVLAALALLLAAASAAGCGGGDDGPRAGGAPPASPAPVPAGFTPVRAGQTVLAHPAGWAAATPPQGWTVMAELRAPGEVTARAGVLGEVPQTADPEIVIAASATALQLGVRGFDRGPGRPLKVPGAARALRVDYTYDDGTPARGTDVAVISPAGSAVVVRVVGTQSGLSPAVVDQIVRTIAVRP